MKITNINKKFISLVLAGTMAFSLVGCAKGSIKSEKAQELKIESSVEPGMVTKYGYIIDLNDIIDDTYGYGAFPTLEGKPCTYDLLELIKDETSTKEYDNSKENGALRNTKCTTTTQNYVGYWNDKYTITKYHIEYTADFDEDLGVTTNHHYKGEIKDYSVLDATNGVPDEYSIKLPDGMTPEDAIKPLTEIYYFKKGEKLSVEEGKKLVETLAINNPDNSQAVDDALSTGTTDAKVLTKSK